MTWAQSYVKFGNVVKLVAVEAAVIAGWSGKGRTARTRALAHIFTQISGYPWGQLCYFLGSSAAVILLNR